jgi:hypothetical protein
MKIMDAHSLPDKTQEYLNKKFKYLIWFRYTAGDTISYFA